MGRPPLGTHAMTSTERAARARASRVDWLKLAYAAIRDLAGGRNNALKRHAAVIARAYAAKPKEK